MNERIQQLAEQAGYKHSDAVGMCEDYAYFDPEKFAQLIVQESIVDFYRRYLDICSEEDITVQVERYVKEHFGVKE
jgi:hypothetical protein